MLECPKSKPRHVRIHKKELKLASNVLNPDPFLLDTHGTALESLSYQSPAATVCFVHVATRVSYDGPLNTLRRLDSSSRRCSFLRRQHADLFLAPNPTPYTPTLIKPLHPKLTIDTCIPKGPRYLNSTYLGPKGLGFRV